MPGEPFETRELWGLHVLPKEDGPWVPFGTETADAASVLRTYDYWQENKPEEPVQIVRTLVELATVDPEDLRKRLDKEAAERQAPGLPSD
jgi:hypothetical protein